MKRLTALGGFDAKGPACFLLEINGSRLLLDMGKGPDAGRRPEFDGIGSVDAVLISHGHGDHIGSLDWLDRVGNPPVHATAPVRALADLPVLRDADDLPPSARIAGLDVETGPSGHAPGAVWLRIGGAQGVVYSGDYADGTGLFPASDPPMAEVAVLDCSYGAETDSIPAQRARLLAAIGDGPCLLPVQPAGRGVEIALACLQAGKDIAICDDIRRVVEVMCRFPEWLAPGSDEALCHLLNAARPLTSDSPLSGVMIAAGANCGSGMSAELGPRAIGAGNVPVIFTGHLSKGAPAGTWVEDGVAQKLMWNVHPDLITIRRLLSCTGAKQVLAAFAPKTAREALSAAIPEAGWVNTGVIEW